MKNLLFVLNKSSKKAISTSLVSGLYRWIACKAVGAALCHRAIEALQLLKSEPGISRPEHTEFSSVWSPFTSPFVCSA